MKYIIRLEEAAMFIACLFGLYYLDADGWYYPAMFIAPDISMIGYLSGRAAGALAYNIFHHKAVAIAFFAAGLYLNNELLMIIGLVLFGHSSMDRMFGYGLKFDRGFNYTHLGIIGKKQKK